jgi:iron-sulfur cluster assembly protein
MITLTVAAATQIRQAAKDADATELALRVAAHVDERTGEIEYGMGFDSERDNDEECIATGVRLLISPHSKAGLEGVTIDYVEMSPGEFNFIFIPANAPSGPGAAAGGGCGGGSGSGGGGCSSRGCGGGGCN